MSLRQQSAYIRQFNFILAVYGAGVTSLLLAAPGTTLLSLQVAVRFASYTNDVICTILLRSPRSHVHPQPSDTLLDYSFFPVHLMMARHVGVQCAARHHLKPVCKASHKCRYLPWAANSDPRFVSVPDRLASAPLHQQLRDSDLFLPLPLVRGIFAQGLRMSACWSALISGAVDEMGDDVGSNRKQEHCVDDESLYEGFEDNRWPKLERRSR